MIRIDKDKYPPEIRYKIGPNKGLLTWRVAERNVLRDYNTDPSPFNDGSYTFRKLYGYEEFRNALEKCQGSKCCFCEQPISGGDIEHFRPKSSWQQDYNTGMNRPGYFWLAYRWENMLISCSKCNENGQKGTLFPVVGTRVTSYTASCSTEDHVIINPADEDPSNYISFNKHSPIGIDSEGRGNENIRIFKLKDRADIGSSRRDHFTLYETQKLIASLPHPFGPITQDHINKAKVHLRVAQKKKQKFAGMIRENIKKGLL